MCIWAGQANLSVFERDGTLGIRIMRLRSFGVVQSRRTNLNMEKSDMQKGKSPKRMNMLRISKTLAMVSAGAMVFQTTGCTFDDVLGANLINTVLQIVLSLFLGGGI